MKSATSQKSSKLALKPTTSTTRTPRSITAATLTKMERNADAGAAVAVAADVADAVTAKAAKRATAKVVTGRATSGTDQSGPKDPILTTRTAAMAALNVHRHQRPALSLSPTSPALQSLRADARIVRVRDATATGKKSGGLRAAGDVSGMRPSRTAFLHQRAKRGPNRACFSPQLQQATLPSRQHARHAQNRDTRRVTKLAQNRATRRQPNQRPKHLQPGRATRPAPASRA